VMVDSNSSKDTSKRKYLTKCIEDIKKGTAIFMYNEGTVEARKAPFFPIIQCVYP